MICNIHFFLCKIDYRSRQINFAKRSGGGGEGGGDSTTNQTKYQSRGQRDMETEKIDFQVLS